MDNFSYNKKKTFEHSAPFVIIFGIVSDWKCVDFNCNK